MYSVTIIGNVEQCRTEAAISDGEGAVLASSTKRPLDGTRTLLSSCTTQLSSTPLSNMLRKTYLTM